MLPGVKQLDIDLPEIQSIDAKEIIKTKLLEAQKHKKGEFIIEDTSLYLDCLNGLPGPLIKWFLGKLGNTGLYHIVKKLGNNKAVAKTIIGYSDCKNQIHFFEGSLSGAIVKPTGKTSFGWDPIFLPNGYNKTFQQMDKSQKNKISMRRKAVNKLKNFLKK